MTLWSHLVHDNEVNMDRWQGIKRPYSNSEVNALQDGFGVRHTIAERGAEKLWALMTRQEDPVRALGALTGNQAMQMVKAGLQAIYVSGWQTAADANVAGQMYPDQSLYPVNSVPELVKRINNALRRSAQIDNSEGAEDISQWLCPIVADAEAGFGGPLNAYELMKSMIEAGVAGVHFEDQLASEKKCGHMGGKVLVPTSQFVRTLIAARLASDVLEVPTVLIARTDADSAKLITSDIDEYDRPFISDEPRTEEGFHHLVGSSMDRCVARGLAYAPYADLLWMETSRPNLEQAKIFADAIHAQYPGKVLAYNCSPSFNWKANLDEATIKKYQVELGKMGYRFQFVTLAGFHALNYGMFNLALAYKAQGMYAYSRLQEDEFTMEVAGYSATKHQREVGTQYFDKVRQAITGGNSGVAAMSGSTEEEQFE